MTQHFSLFYDLHPVTRIFVLGDDAGNGESKSENVFPQIVRLLGMNHELTL